MERDQVGVDDAFYEKVRVPPEKRVGVEWDEYVALMDEAGIEASLIISVKAGDTRVKHSFAIEDERVAEYCSRYPGRMFGLCGIDPSRIRESMRNLERAVTEYGFGGRTPVPALVRAGLPTTAGTTRSTERCCGARRADHDADRPLPRLQARPHPRPVGRPADARSTASQSTSPSCS